MFLSGYLALTIFLLSCISHVLFYWILLFNEKYTRSGVSYVSGTVISSFHGLLKINEVFNKQQAMRVDLYNKMCSIINK